MKKKQDFVMALLLLFAVTISSCAQNSTKDVSSPPSNKKESPSRSLEQSLNFSDAPAGFSWRQYRDVAFLLPDGWVEHTMILDKNGYNIDTYATSPTEFSATNKFETGFTMEIFSDLYKNKGITPKIMAAKLITSVKKENILLLDTQSRNGFEQYYMRFKDETQGLPQLLCIIL